MPFVLDSLSPLEMRITMDIAHSSTERSGHWHQADPRAEAQRLLSWMVSDRAREAVSAQAPGPSSDATDFEAALAADLAFFEAGERLQGAVDDAQLSALARMHATALAELDARHAQAWMDRTPLTTEETVVMEVATATGLSQTDVRLRLDLAIGPAARVAFLREQVASGATTLQRACQLVTATRHLPDDLLDLVARAALAPTRDGAGLPPSRFRQRLRRALVAADTAAGSAAASRRAARERVGVFARLYDDGTGCLTITNDAEKVAAAYDRADAAARAARQGGDPRTLDQLRADFLTGAAIAGWPDEGTFESTHAQTSPADEPDGGAATSPFTGDDPLTGSPTAASMADSNGQTPAAPHPNGGARFGAIGPHPAATAWIVVPWTTAAGLDDDPCELPGHGWVAAAHAREIISAEGSVWRTLLADVDTGRAMALSRRGYRPTREMVEHVRAVDGTCRGPGCDVLAARCDIDHSRGFDRSDPDATTNLVELGALHRAHHRLRTAGLWQAVRDKDGQVSWRTSAGRRYLTYPRDWFGGSRATPAPNCSDQAPSGTRPHEGGGSTDLPPHQRSTHPPQPDRYGPAWPVPPPF